MQKLSSMDGWMSNNERTAVFYSLYNNYSTPARDWHGRLGVFSFVVHSDFTGFRQSILYDYDYGIFYSIFNLRIHTSGFYSTKGNQGLQPGRPAVECQNNQME